MMIISDGTIEKLLKNGDLSIDPLDDEQIQPASIDLRLGRSFMKISDFRSTHINLETPIDYQEIEHDFIILPPQTFVLATTKEYIKLPNYLTAFVEGRSSIGRIGLFIQNAGWVDPGFEGEITLELFNANQIPIKIEADRRICQLVLAKMDQAAKTPYNGKYQKQRRATGSLIHQDTEVSQT